MANRPIHHTYTTRLYTYAHLPFLPCSICHCKSPVPLSWQGSPLPYPPASIPSPSPLPLPAIPRPLPRLPALSLPYHRLGRQHGAHSSADYPSRYLYLETGEKKARRECREDDPAAENQIRGISGRSGGKGGGGTWCRGYIAGLLKEATGSKKNRREE